MKTETGSPEIKSAGTPFRSRGANPFGIQPKLFVNTPGDKQEAEADRAADRVVRGNAQKSAVSSVSAPPPTSNGARGKFVKFHNNPEKSTNTINRKDDSITNAADKETQLINETGNSTEQGKAEVQNDALKQQETENTNADESPKNEFKDSLSLTKDEPIKILAQVETENSFAADDKEPIDAPQLEEDKSLEQVSQTTEETAETLVNPAQKQDPETTEENEVSNEETRLNTTEPEGMVENVSAAAGSMVIQLSDLEKSYTESIGAYRRVTQKNISKLHQQSEKALQTCDSVYYQQASLIENGYGNAVRKVKKALNTTLTDLSKGKSNSRKKLTGIVENKVKKTGYLTWNKQQEAGAMGSEFVSKTWKYANDLKGNSDKKAHDQKEEIKSNGDDAKRKYKNHEYRADVNEAVDESVLDYCETINESTADLKEALSEDAIGMVTNFKEEAVGLKALLPQGKQQVIQNILAIGRDGAKQFSKVDQDVLPTLRKQMHLAEVEMRGARKRALMALRNMWMQSRQGIKEQQKQLELTLRNSEKQAVKESKQVMTEVRAEHRQDPTIGSQLGVMNVQMKKSPGELAAAQHNLLQRGGTDRQKGLQSARKGMIALASDSVKQAKKMATTAEKGAAKLKAGALKGYGQVVAGTEKAINKEINRYEQSLDKALGKARKDWAKKLSEGTWGMRKKAYSTWYENGKLRKESRSELFAVAKDASEIDFWDVLEAIGNFLLGVLAVLALILIVVVIIWAIGALLTSLGVWLVAITAEYAIGAFVAALVVGIEMLITGILTSTVFWVAASAYGIYSGYETIKNAKNNPDLTRSDAAYAYGSGTAEIILSLIPFWGKFKGRTKGGEPQDLRSELDNLNPKTHGQSEINFDKKIETFRKQGGSKMGDDVLFEVKKLQRILSSLEKRGISVWMNSESERFLKQMGAEAMYWDNLPGQPGTLVLPPNPTRAQVIEELKHLGQHRLRSWQPAGGNKKIAEIEIQTQEELIEFATKNNWNSGEIKKLEDALEYWSSALKTYE